MEYSRNELSISNTLDTVEPLPAYSQYLNLMGQADPVLSVSDRAGMALVYGPPATAVTNIVTNTQDSGAGSLRAAMYYAFDHPGTTIRLSVPTSDPGFSNSVFNVLPTGALPSLVNGMVIDGSTEPTNSILIKATALSAGDANGLYPRLGHLVDSRAPIGRRPSHFIIPLLRGPSARFCRLFGQSPLHSPDLHVHELVAIRSRLRLD